MDLLAPPALHAGTVSHATKRWQQVREAVLLSFCEPLPKACCRLCDLSVGEWKRLLPWLDTSGLALYFLDRLTELHLQDLLPPAIWNRLQQNLEDNTERMRDLMAESAAIQRDFQTAGVSYAVLKGFSLWPYSVPRLELRSQLDLDFLVAERHAAEARRLLETHGYSLHAISGRSWEFKTLHHTASSLKDLYKRGPSRCVELHLEAESSGSPLLARTARRDFSGLSMPVLPPADLFLGQGLHLYKHLLSEYSRTAHLLEFRRHVLAYRNRPAFWERVRSLAEDHPRGALALGISTLVVTNRMGNFAPQELLEWTIPPLPDAAHRWVSLYGARATLADFPGTKLYLLLQRELELQGVPVRRSARRALLPLRLPPPIAPVPATERFSERLARYRAQLRFVLMRLRFHMVEGLRYLYESRRWRSRREG